MINFPILGKIKNVCKNFIHFYPFFTCFLKIASTISERSKQHLDLNKTSKMLISGLKMSFFTSFWTKQDFPSKKKGFATFSYLLNPKLHAKT